MARKTNEGVTISGVTISGGVVSQGTISAPAAASARERGASPSAQGKKPA